LEDKDGWVIVQEWKMEGYEKWVFNEILNNTRPMGKPRIRWRDVVRRDT